MRCRSPSKDALPIIATRWLKLCCAALAVALMAGCSAVRIAYGTAPDIVYWWLDGYIDFTGEQKPKAHQAIDDWFAWHRRTQLPDYANLLARARTEVQADTTPEKVCAWSGELTGRTKVAFDRIAPSAADLMLMVTPEQIRFLAGRYDKFNDEYREEYLQPVPADRAKANLKRTIKQVEQLYGSLNDAQVAMLGEALARSPFDPEVWLAERQARQQAVLALLRRLRAENASREQALAGLRDYVAQLERSPRADYRRYAEGLQRFNCGLTAQLQNSTTRAQRQKAASRLAGWEEDLRVLAAAADKPARSAGNGP